MKNSIDMLHGPLLGKVVRFALPLAATNVLQQLFNSADVAVVGKFAGSDSLAAVGATTPVTNLIINLFVGLAVGANVVVARALGRNDRESARRAVSTAMVTAVVCGFIMVLLGFTVTKPLLRLMATPENVLDRSALYMKIYFSGMPFIMVYNFGAAILRSVGDTKRPLICLFCSGLLNVALNLVFVIVLKMDVAGVALATVLSNVLCSCLIVSFLLREQGAIRLNVKELRVDGGLLRQIIAVGVPAGVQGMVFSIANVCIQSNVNAYGSTVVAGSSSALNFELYAAFLFQGFGQAATTFVSQNFGAGDLERCHKSYKCALGMGALLSTALAWICVIFARQFMMIFTSDPEVIEVGVVRVRTITIFMFLNATLDITAGSLRGLGHSAMPAAIAMLFVCGVRLGFVYTIYKKLMTFRWLMAVYPISWAVAAAVMVFFYFKVYRGLRSGKTLSPASNT